MVKDIYELNKLYTLVFIRKVFNFGIMKSKLVRAGILGLAVILFLILLFSIYIFMSDIKSEVDIISFIIKSYSLTVSLWTVITVLIVKIVFSKSDSFFKITENFPITKHTITLSIFIFELLFSLILVSTISMAFIISILLNGYLNYIEELITNIFYVNILVFLILQLLSKILIYICTVTRITKVYTLLNTVMLISIFIYLYKHTYTVVSSIAQDFLNHESKTKSLVLLLNSSLEKFGFIFTSVIVIVVSMILVSSIIKIVGEVHSTPSKYLKLLDIPKNTNHLYVYIASSFRHINMLTNIVSAYVFSLLLISINLENYILYTLLIICFNAIYYFVQTLEIRYISYNFKYSAINDYLLMLISQIIIVYISGIPLIITYICLNNGLDTLFFTTLASITISPILLLMLGILLPPYKDNPFTVLTSIIIISVPIVFIVTATELLNLGFITNVLIYALLIIFAIIFSVYGLKILEKRFKYEKNSAFN